MAGSGIRKYLRAAGLDPANGPTDAELIAQFADHRDEAAFELLVFRHAGLVQRACRAVLNDHHAAEDAAQATFLALARKAGSVGRGTVVGWLYRVARRVAVRAAKRRAPVAVAELYDAPARASSELEEDTVAAICAEVDRLPERYRVPVLLCFFEGLTHTEAARRAGVPVGTVAGRLARAKDLLAKRLSRRGLALASVALPVVSGTFAGSTARAACAFAAGRSVELLVSESVLSLARGALKPMIPNSLKLFGAIAFACATVGGVLAFVPGAPPVDSPLPPALGGPKVPVAAATAADPKLPDADVVQRRHSLNNLKQILLAMHNYESTYGEFPNDVTDKNGKALLSWRVLILPYIEQDALFKEFKLDEPWDSETNKKLLDKMPRVYRTFDADKKATKTYYQVFSGPGTAFEPGKKLKITQVTDGTSNTLGVIEAGPAVEWTKPADINYDAKKAFPRPVGRFANTFLVGMMDGSARALKPDLKDEVFRHLVEIADGNVIPEGLNASFPAATKEEKELAAKMFAENLEMAKELTAALTERQKLIELLLKKKPAAGPNLDELAAQHEGLKRELESIKRDIEELKQKLKEK
jgi:RNA polymerase sigma factor (sigma-70 family)